MKDRSTILLGKLVETHRHLLLWPVAYFSATKHIGKCISTATLDCGPVVFVVAVVDASGRLQVSLESQSLWQFTLCRQVRQFPGRTRKRLMSPAPSRLGTAVQHLKDTTNGDPSLFACFCWPWFRPRSLIIHRCFRHPLRHVTPPGCLCTARTPTLLCL